MFNPIKIFKNPLLIQLTPSKGARSKKHYQKTYNKNKNNVM